ncbi:extracellular matrix organizing protein FRAS1-like [Daphnia carinata]|uniref:extracellular matrix organizing protein FRAS1-like n=1 Tax=Daphnia carinata TaxID=120202 RepID=UPI0028692707|nr:extracellular matrix organizing protein FRAS1-like [Daphnia carinata]
MRCTVPCSMVVVLSFLLIIGAYCKADSSSCPEGCICADVSASNGKLECRRCRPGYHQSKTDKGRPKCSQQEVQFQQDGPLMSIPSVREGDVVTISERYFVVLDAAVDKETVEYILARPTQMGSILLSGKVLQIGDTITRNDVIQGRLSFRADKEVGWLPAQDRLFWNVSAAKRDDMDEKNGRGRNVLVNGRVLDSSGKVLRRTEDTIKRARDENGAGGLAPLPRVPLRPESLMIAIEPRDNQSPDVVVHGEVNVDEGATEILSPDIISVNDSDTRPVDLVVVINDGPKHGYLEVRDRSGQRKVVTEFPLSALLEEQLSYVQNDYKGSEPRQDSFRFHVRDTSGNRSPPAQLDIIIENVNDEPPQITTRPLLLSMGQDRVVLTGDHFDIQDQDSDPSDLQVTLVAQPTNGRLQRFDPLANSDRTLQDGETFDYQELLDGNIAFISSAEESQIVFQVSDGDSPSQEVTLRYINKQQDEELFGRSGTATPCMMEFNTTEWKAFESSGIAPISVVRTGDLSITCSVICSTEAQSADDSKDFESRPMAESSRVFFLRGVTIIYCPVQLKDDHFYEGDETFLARLSHPQVEQLDTNDQQSLADQPNKMASSSAEIGSRSQLAVRIQDDEDVTRVQFNQSVYRPSTSPGGESVTLHVERTGDLRFASKAFISNVDGSAKEGRDYVLKSRQSLDFAPGEQWSSLTITILQTSNKNTWPRSFQIVLNSEDSINAQLGASKTSATILIPPAVTSGPALLPAEPIVVSLMDYDRLGADLDKRPTSVPAGYPVVCVTPCDPKYPLYNISTQRLCRSMAIDVSKIRFSWEISPPLSTSKESLGETTTGPFYRLSEPTAFSGVEDRVLDAVFFRHDFRVRCVAQPVRLDPGMMVGPASKSRPVTVSGQSGLCPPFSPSSISFDDATTDVMVAGQQPFSASLSYINASDAQHPDTMRIQVVVPHSDGLIPILSTQPLHGIRHIMNEPAYRSHHRCSNLHPSMGFLDGGENENSTSTKLPFEFSKNIRQESAVRLYRHLDSTGCLWHFEAWYSMTELIQLCGGQVTSNFQTMNRGQVQVTVRVPLYVTLIGASTGSHQSWTSVEHQTEMEFSFSYASVLLGQRGVTESKLALAVQPHVTRVRTDPNNGRLVVEFQTETRFTGRYLEAGSRLLSPTHHHFVAGQLLGFDLELMWNQIYPTGATFQKWRAVSNYTLQDYTGNYTLVLAPCPASPDQPQQTQPNKFGRLVNKKEDCQTADAFNVTLPIHYQQPFRPEPVHYSLETTFQLTNDVRAFLRKPRSINDIKDAEFEGSFHNGERVYGRVLWHPSNELSPGYRLWIEKLYLCAGRDGYVPLFEPNAERPQFGCLENSQRLKYRLLLLDREDPYGSDKAVQGLSLDAKFASQVDQLRTGMAHLPNMDGFVFSVDPLFQLEPGIRWFLQVSYSVQPVTGSGSMFRWKRQEAGSQQTRRGTNMRFLPLDWPGSGDSRNSSGSHDGDQTPAVLASTLLLSAGLLVILVMAVLIVFSVYYRPTQHKNKDSSDQKSSGVGASSAQDDEEDNEATPMKALNNNGRMASTSASVKITLV